MPIATSQTFLFDAADGTPLAATHFPTSVEAPRVPVLIAGALAVGQRLYRPFAEWLSAQGHAAMTFDLRGMGASRLARHRRSLRGLDIDMLGWARLDFAAAVAELSARHGGAAVGVIGHSLGLHHAAMTDAATQARIAIAVGVASGAGYWRDWAPPTRRLAPLIFFIAGPLCLPVFGYFPGRRLRMVGDLPKGVMRQWSRWCRHPKFAWGAQPDELGSALAAARFPIVAFSFSDDEAMTEYCTRKLLGALPNAPSRVVRLAPADVGMGAIGHLGPFSAAARDRLWPMLLDALESERRFSASPPA